uniref:ORF163 n=1 Tax=Sciadococcus taiwanensis TaxID=3028030 RepID=A0A9Y1MX22_9RHOD|nr:ORF163 [Sciadococcus taiwanensis]
MLPMRNKNKVLTPRYNIIHLNFYYMFLSLLQEIYVLTSRLFIQLIRRPSTLIAGIIQPLLWLVLFGALFQNAPVGIFSNTNSYIDFLTPGIIVFTAFGGALNAGLPIMFDREFGFFNRLLVVPLVSRLSITISCSIFIAFLSILQSIFIILFTHVIGVPSPTLLGLLLVSLIILLLTVGITSISLLLAFLLPGHVELLATLLVINLPLLFASTALAPLHFMPAWLQIVASLNPLTYAIEPVRYLYSNISLYEQQYEMGNIWGELNLLNIIKILITFDLSTLLILKFLLRKKIR